MAITAAELEQFKKEWAANCARQEAMTNEGRFAAGEFTIDLMRAQDDPKEGEPAFQEELSRFSAALRAEGIPYSQTAIAMDAVDAHGFPLPEFIVGIKELARSPVVVALAGAIAGWVQGRNGRKARIRIGDVEAEGRTIKEVAALLEMAASFQDRHEGGA